MHENAKDHICEFCNKGFTQSYTLKVRYLHIYVLTTIYHLRDSIELQLFFQEHIASKHTKVYKHHCQECGRSFAHRTNFVRHMKFMHKTNLTNKDEKVIATTNKDETMEQGEKANIYQLEYNNPSDEFDTETPPIII